MAAATFTRDGAFARVRRVLSDLWVLVSKIAIGHQTKFKPAIMCGLASFADEHQARKG